MDDLCDDVVRVLVSWGKAGGEEVEVISTVCGPDCVPPLSPSLLSSLLSPLLFDDCVTTEVKMTGGPGVGVLGPGGAVVGVGAGELVVGVSGVDAGDGVTVVGGIDVVSTTVL